MSDPTNVQDADNQDTATDADATLESQAQDTQQTEDASQTNESVDTVRAKLAEVEQARATIEKSYRELQSLKDRQLSEMGERLARMEGALSQRPANAGDAEAADKKAWDEYITGLADRAEEHPRELATALRDILPVMRDDAVRRAKADLAEKIAAVENRLKEVELAPIRSQHKETIEALTKDGIPEEVAIQVARVLGKTNRTIHQPPESPAPGRTVDAGRKAPEQPKLKMPVLSPEHAQVFDGMLNALGLDEAKRKTIILNTAKELAQQ